MILQETLSGCYEKANNTCRNDSVSNKFIQKFVLWLFLSLENYKSEFFSFILTCGPVLGPHRIYFEDGPCVTHSGLASPEIMYRLHHAPLIPLIMCSLPTVTQLFSRIISVINFKRMVFLLELQLNII